MPLLQADVTWHRELLLEQLMWAVSQSGKANDAFAASWLPLMMVTGTLYVRPMMQHCRPNHTRDHSREQVCRNQ